MLLETERRQIGKYFIVYYRYEDSAENQFFQIFGDEKNIETDTNPIIDLGEGDVRGGTSLIPINSIDEAYFLTYMKNMEEWMGEFNKIFDEDGSLSDPSLYTKEIQEREQKSLEADDAFNDYLYRCLTLEEAIRASTS